MVSEKIICEVLGDAFAITRSETVPVCEACVQPKERHGDRKRCTVCGCEMMSDRTDLCSNGCAQRRRRARYKHLRPMVICVGCGRQFAPKRRDAKFCSLACKQRAYRIRSQET